MVGSDRLSRLIWPQEIRARRDTNNGPLVDVWILVPALKLNKLTTTKLEVERMDLKLDNIGLGAVSEKFNIELARVIENIVDYNTEAKIQRSITIQLKIKPDIENRESCTMEAIVSSKLAQARAHISTLNVGINRVTGEVNAMELIQEQASLFPTPEPQAPNVVNMKEAMNND